MSISIQEVYHEQFGKIRVVVVKGVCYFVGKDAAKALRFRDPDQALRMHVQAQDKFTFNPDNLKKLKNPDGVKVAHNAIWINESGLNALTLKAKVAFAQSFRTWLINPDADSEPNILYHIHAGFISKFVYVLEMDDNTVKIEIAHNVSQRIKAIQKENGTQVLKQYSSKVIDAKLAAEIESKCHAAFADKRAHGEYFNITFEEGCAELNKYSAGIDAANIELEKMLNIRTGSYQSEVKPVNNPLIEDFTKREKVEILMKLLNLNLPAPLRNRIVNQILLVISDEYEIICEKLAQEI